MTYNFDPDRWYENERSAIAAIRKKEKWSDKEYEKSLENLGKRYESCKYRPVLRPINR